MDAFLKAAKDEDDSLRELFRDLHRHPELSFHETRTTECIKAEMERLGLELIDLGLFTGVVALLRGGKPGKTVGIRADIDALAVRENPAAPVVSVTPGVMHACGHDFHTAVAVGAARVLAAHREQLAGDVAFVFQPAEEVTQGARAMVQNGLFDVCPMDALFSLHAAPFASGNIGAKAGPMAAGKTKFRIRLVGKGGQAGFPHESVDVVVAGAAVIAGIQTVVSRNADPLGALVCGVHNAHAGDHEFFVPDEMVLSGSIRALDADMVAMAEERVKTLATGIAAAYGCGCEVELMRDVPPLVNAESLAAVARRAAVLAVGEEHVVAPEPMLGSDDFSVFGEYAPIFYYRVGITAPGTAPVPLHKNDFCADEAALVPAVATLARAAALALEDGALG